MTGRTGDGRIETRAGGSGGSPVANYAFDVTPARLVTGPDHRARRAAAGTHCACERISRTRCVALNRCIDAHRNGTYPRGDWRKYGGSHYLALPEIGDLIFGEAEFGKHLFGLLAEFRRSRCHPAWRPRQCHRLADQRI